MLVATEVAGATLRRADEPVMTAMYAMWPWMLSAAMPKTASALVLYSYRFATLLFSIGRKFRTSSP